MFWSDTDFPIVFFKLSHAIRRALFDGKHNPLGIGVEFKKGRNPGQLGGSVGKHVFRSATNRNPGEL